MAKQRKRGGKPRGIQESQVIEITDPNILDGLAGEESCNLKVLSDVLDIKVSHVREGILVEGQDSGVLVCCEVINQLINIITKGELVTPDDVESAVKLIESDRSASIENLFGRKISFPGRSSVVAKNDSQRKLIDIASKNDVLFVEGPAGTGKTFLAIALAVEALLKRKVKRIILSRPAVEAGEKLGFLPGDMAEKVNPYLRPLYDSLFELVGQEKLAELSEKKMLEIAPLAFMRGRTLSSAFVILDEAQNTTTVQMKMFLTRLGKNSKFIITGDVSQQDLQRGQSSGMSDAMRRLSHVDGIGLLRFSAADVVRHSLLTRILSAYESGTD